RALAQRRDFSKVSPEKVLRLLAAIGAQGPQESLTLAACTPHNTVHHRRVRASLMKIWQLAHDRYQEDAPLRFKWHRIMANCNSIYAQFATPSEHPPARPRVAAGM